MTVALHGASLQFSGGKCALDNISLTLGRGEQVAIIGPSGAGKTSLLHLLATGLQPTTGELQLLATSPRELSATALRQLRSRIGLIQQSPPLPPRQRVVTAVLAGKLGQWSLAKSLLNLAHPVDIHGASATLAKLDLADKLFARCDTLSGGQLQRAGIARVLYQAPELVLADEPVSAMDPVLAAHTLGVLCEDARQRNATLVTSLHAVELALAHFPRIIGLRDGRIVFDRSSTTVTAADLEMLYANEQLSSHDTSKHAVTAGTVTHLAMPGY
jgi:phosphonate transport system ATP-binding protein